MTTIEITDQMVDAAILEMSNIINTSYREEYRRGCVKHGIAEALKVAATIPAETPPQITDQMVDRAERWLCGHDAWELPYGSTGSGEAARTILEDALADPPVRGSADGMVEPGPPKVEVAARVEQHERDLEAFSVDLQKLSQEMTALRERVEAMDDDLDNPSRLIPKVTLDIDPGPMPFPTHRIDPDDPKQVRAVAVAVAMAAPERPSYCTAEQAKRILTALKGGAR